MLEILKNLTPEELGKVLIVLGLVRESRKFLNEILQYKLEKQKLEKE